MKNGSDVNPPDVLALLERGIHGDGPDLETALKSAWERGKSSGHRVFRVQEIYVWGDNPISGYRVVVNPIPS